MRLVYADEAGISNPKQEPFLIVAATIVHADQKLVAVERHLDRLVERHIPTEHQKDFVFHATEIFNGGGKVFKRTALDDPNPEWPLDRRLKIAADLAAIPKRFQLPIALGWVERATWPQTFEIPPDTKDSVKVAWCHVGAFMCCAMQVERWMRRNASHEVCLMVVEDNDNARRLIRDTQRYHQDRDLSELLDAQVRKDFPFRKIKEDPLFQPKRKSSPLQIADFCAYVWKRILMNSTDPLYAPFYGAFREQIVWTGDQDLT